MGKFNPKVLDLLEDVTIPIDFAVNPKTPQTLVIPMKIRENASASQEGEVHIANFTFAGPNGWAFGEDFQVKFTVKKKELDQTEFYQLAMNIFFDIQAAKRTDISFEKVVDELRKNNNNALITKKVLLATEEDLYS